MSYQGSLISKTGSVQASQDSHHPLSGEQAKGGKEEEEAERHHGGGPLHILVCRDISVWNPRIRRNCRLSQAGPRQLDALHLHGVGAQLQLRDIPLRAGAE